MGYLLKIFDIHIKHNERETNTTYYDLAMNHPELLNNISPGNGQSANIQRQVVFDSFKQKMSSDLNSEILKNTTTKKIIKKSRFYNGSSVESRVLQLDHPNKILYGVLHGGRITENAMLETPTNNDFDYRVLSGDRIYDDFFFMIHISFNTNVARLFIINGGNNTNVDSVLKKYFKDNLFNAPNFNKPQVADYIPPEYREEVLNRSTINSITVSKTDKIITQSDGIEYEVEIKLKPTSTNPVTRIIEAGAHIFRRSQVQLQQSETNDQTGMVKMSIKDPETNRSKTIAFGEENEFIPRIVLDETEVFNTRNQIRLTNLKDICMEYLEIQNIEMN